MSRILIVGGGIGGMSAAIALAQRGGHRIDLIEREAGWRALGAGLTLNGASMRVLDDLGVLDEVMDQGYGAPGTSQAFTADGHLIMDTNRERLFGPRIPNMGGIMRPVLHEILKAAVRRHEISVRTGVTPTDLHQHDDEIHAIFSDDTEGEYDLAIGADGLFSQLRQIVMPEAPQPEFTGQGCWRAVIPRPANQEVAGVYYGRYIKTGFNPVSSTQMYLFALVPVPGNPYMPPERWPELLKEALAEFGGQIAHIRDHDIGPDSLINYRPLEGILLEGNWYRGRTLLIGDASHATTPHIGYGAGLAMEDGVVLADELQKNPTIEDAFAAFMKRRFDRCAAVVRGSRRLGELELAAAPAEQSGRVFGELMARIREPI